MTRYRRMNRPDGKKELDGDIVVDRPPLVIEGTKGNGRKQHRYVTADLSAGLSAVALAKVEVPAKADERRDRRNKDFHHQDTKARRMETASNRKRLEPQMNADERG
jgi:hypothetical protein